MELKDVHVVPEVPMPNGMCGRSGRGSDQLNLPARQTNIQNIRSSSSSLIRSERGQARDRKRERLNTEILQAATTGDKVLIRSLLDEGGSVNATCRQSGQTALHVAASKGHADLVKMLMELGANPEARDKLGRQPVHLAAWNGHMYTLACFSKELLSSPIQLSKTSLTEGDLDSWNHKHEDFREDCRDFSEGSTPLHLVCKKSNLTCVRFLLHIGVFVDAKDSDGLTPLDVLGSNDDDIAPPEADPSIGTPSILSENVAFNPEGADTLSFDSIPFRLPRSISKLSGTRDKKVYAPVIEDASKDTNEAKAKKSFVTLIAKSLIEKGAEMPSALRNQNKSQMTALHTAVEDDNVEMVSLLLNQNGCMLTLNDEGYTPLHVAVKNKFVEPLKAMLKYRDNPLEVVDVRDSQGRTPLHLAVMTEWGDGVCLLLEHGANVTTFSNYKENVFHLVAERGNSHMLEELLSMPDAIKVLNNKDRDSCTPLCKAVDNGYLDCAKLLVNSGGDSNVILPDGQSLIHLAVENNFPYLLEYLLNETSAGNLKDSRCLEERGGLTPLQTAAMLGFEECVSILLTSGCDVRLKSTEEPHLGSNALHLAARAGHDMVLTCLLNSLENDFDVLTCKDSRGWPPLHIAASNGHAKCVSTLIEYGADLADYIVDEKGTPLTGLEVIIYCIPQSAEFLVEVFDSYIKTNDYPVSDPNCEIRVRFDVLTPRTSSYKHLRVLNALLNCGKEKIQEKLLLHPIVKTFLHLKWRKLRLFFFILMAFYLAFSLSLTTLAVWYYILKMEASSVIRIVHCIFFISLVPIVLAEGLNVLQLQRYYIFDPESWVKWLVIIFSIIIGLTDPTQWWARHLAASTVLLAWIELLFLVARCPNWGFYVHMFSRVAIKVFKVLATFTFLLLGFTFAFMIMFDGNGSFSTVWLSIVKVFVMMIEFDYEATFENVDSDDWVSVVGRAMFLFFVLLVAIVLMNLMVGLAVSDIAVLETQGRTQRLAKQVSFLSLLEVLVGSRYFLISVPDGVRTWAENSYSIVPEVVVKAGGASLECNEDCLPRYLKDVIIEKATSVNHKYNSSTTTLSDLAMQVAKLENSSPVLSEVAEIKDMLFKQAATLQQLQYQLQQLLST